MQIQRGLDTTVAVSRICEYVNMLLDNLGPMVPCRGPLENQRAEVYPLVANSRPSPV